MIRLINAEALKEDYPEDEDWDYPVNTNEYVVESIDRQPTVDAIPVEWIRNWVRRRTGGRTNGKTMTTAVIRELVNAWYEEEDE